MDLCIYCAGIGELLDISNMEPEVGIFDVNLTGMVKTAACVIPSMAKSGKGHFIGLSSVADEMLSPEAPSYHASKAGFSNYLEGLALALKSKGVSVSNVRFGFVDTKMAKGDIKPFMITLDILYSNYDGWQLLENLKKDPGTKHIPIVIFSIRDESQKGLNLGADDYLVKPIQSVDYVNVVRKFWDMSHMKKNNVS